MVRPERFELPTPCFVGKCSIQLSYGRKQTRRTFEHLTLQILILHAWPHSVNAPVACQLAGGGPRTSTESSRPLKPAGRPCPRPHGLLYLSQGDGFLPGARTGPCRDHMPVVARAIIFEAGQKELQSDEAKSTCGMVYLRYAGRMCNAGRVIRPAGRSHDGKWKRQ